MKRPPFAYRDAAKAFAVQVTFGVALQVPGHMGGPIATRLGCHPDVGIVGLWILLLGLYCLYGLRLVPGNRRSLYLRIWLTGAIFIGGIAAIIRYSNSSWFDRWPMARPLLLGVVSFVALYWLLLWVDRNYPGGLAEVWRRAMDWENTRKPKKKISADDFGLD